MNQTGLRGYSRRVHKVANAEEHEEEEVGEEVDKFSDNRIKCFRHRQSVERKFR